MDCEEESVLGDHQSLTLSFSQPCDVSVRVDSHCFHLHKDILSKNCDYFKAMFSSQMIENTQNIIDVKLIERKPFEVLLNGFYSGNLSLTSENVFDVTLTAHILQVSSALFQQCCSFLINLIDAQRCFEIMHFAEYHYIQEVYSACRRYCLIHFLTLCKEESFYLLSINEVKDYLSDKFLVADEEIEVVKAFSDWCHYNKFSEVKEIQDTLSLITQSSTDLSEIFKQVAKKISTGEKFDDSILRPLSHRSLNQDALMFWARLSNSSGEGLVDVVKLDDCLNQRDETSIKAMRIDTMTNLVQKPGFDLGSAVCVKGPYVYVCGGGPNFGRMNWIRDLWRYSVYEERDRWKAVGKLPTAWRYHTMVAVGTKLYIFGGFGKFRSKNCNLDSFDIVEGTWSQHANIPKHEIKPVATCHQSTIFYVCLEWKVYAYNTKCDQWNILQRTQSLDGISASQQEVNLPSAANHIKPLSCFVFPNKSNLSILNLTIVSHGVDFHTHVIHLDLVNNLFLSSTPPVKYDLDVKTNIFLGSSFLEGQMVAFFKTINAEVLEFEFWTQDESDQQDRQCSPVQVIQLSETGDLLHRTQINNVVKTLSVVSVPRFPKAFCLKGK